MKQSKKICKGMNRAKSYEGCGDEVYRFRYGLCRACYKTFMTGTKEGIYILKKARITAKKEVNKQARLKRKKALEGLRTKSEWEAILQKEINKIARTIDKGHTCISSGKPLNPKHDAGHYYSVGSNPTLRFNLHNIFAQSVSDNQFKGGNPIEYIINVANLFGEEYADEVVSLRKRYSILKLSIPEIEVAIGKSRKFLKYIKKISEYSPLRTRNFSHEERIELRREANIMIGIYED